jgi:hypothetical protein
MYTAYEILAESHSPYISMGLGTYYTIAPGTFAERLKSLQDLFSLYSWILFEYLEEVFRARLHRFLPTEYQTPSCKPPDSPHFRISTRCQADNLIAGYSL